MTPMRPALLALLLLTLAACTGGRPVAQEATPAASTPSVVVVATSPAAPSPSAAATLAPLPATGTVAAPTEVVASPTGVVPPTFTPAVIPVATGTTEVIAEPSGVQPDEAIWIQEPGPGSVVTSPIQVRGVANPTFEQALLVRLVSADGIELALVPTTIAADLGQRGPFEVAVPFTVGEETPAFIQVITESARDGGPTHVSSVGVRLSATGPATLQPNSEPREAIAIVQPVAGTTVSGGTLHIEGVGRPGFENTLVVDLLDGDGNTLARQAITVNAELGQWGPFSADIPYTATASGPGRVTVRDISPAFGGTAHLSSVEVTVAP